MRRERWERGLVVAFGGAAMVALGCAPDLTIGGGTTSTGGGGAGTTSSGGVGGTTSSAGGELGDALWLDYLPVGGDDVPKALVFADKKYGYAAGNSTNTDMVRQAVAYRLLRQSEGNWFFEALAPSYGGPHSADAITWSKKGYFLAGELLGDTADPATPESTKSHGGSDCLAGKVDGFDTWFRAIGTNGFSACAGVVATDAAVYVAGTFSAALDVDVKGDGLVLQSSGGYDMFIAKLGPDGGPMNAWRYGDSYNQRVQAMGSDAAGNLYLLGSDESGSPVGHADIVVLKVSPDGAAMETRRYGGSGDERPLQLAVGADGTTAIAGTLSGSIDVGGGAIGGQELVAVFDPQGKHVWSHGVSHEGKDGAIHALLLDDERRLFVGGGFVGSLTLGGQLVSADSGDGHDAFHAGLDAQGHVLWMRSFGGPQEQSIGALAFAPPDGVLVAVGHYGGTLDLAGKTPSAVDASDPFLLGIAR